MRAFILKNLILLNVTKNSKRFSFNQLRYNTNNDFFVPIFELESKEMFASDFLWAKVFNYINSFSLISITLYKNRKNQILYVPFQELKLQLH